MLRKRQRWNEHENGNKAHTRFQKSQSAFHLFFPPSENVTCASAGGSGSRAYGLGNFDGVLFLACHLGVMRVSTDCLDPTRLAFVSAGIHAKSPPGPGGPNKMGPDEKASPSYNLLTSSRQTRVNRIGLTAVRARFHETPSLENDIVARALADIGDPAVAVVANVLAHGDTRQLRCFDDDSRVYGFYLDTFSVTSRPRYRS